MLRKSLVIGSIVLMLVMLFALAGCENPAGSDGSPGPAGPQGPQGPTGNTGPEGWEAAEEFTKSNVTAEDLKDAFALSKYVILRSSVETVYGVVPKDCILYVAGYTTVGDFSANLLPNDLEVEGKIDIRSGAVLNATGIDLGSGYEGFLTGSGEITTAGTGYVLLPYNVQVSPAPAFRADVITYMSENVTGLSERAKRVGSITTGASAVIRLTGAGVAMIFALDGSPDSLTVPGIVDVETASVPHGKTLTLADSPTGFLTPPSSSLRDVSTFNPAGYLFIEGTLDTESTNSSHIAGAHIEITETGTLVLNHVADDITSSTIKNKGVITTVTNDEVDLLYLIDSVGGNIEATGALDTIPSAITSVTIKDGTQLTLDNVGTTFATGSFTLTVQGKLTLAASVNSFAPPGNVIIDGGSLELEPSSKITIASASILTIDDSTHISGAGIIEAVGSTSGSITIGTATGYTTGASGVEGGVIRTALDVFAEEKEGVLKDKRITGLNGAIGGGGENGIGTADFDTAPPTVGDPRPIVFSANGKGRPITVQNKTVKIEGSTGESTSYAYGTGAAGDFEVEIDPVTGNVIITQKVTYSGSTQKVMVTFADVKLNYQGLIANSALTAFSVGIFTTK